MTPRIRAAEVRLSGLERALLSVQRRLIPAINREDAGDEMAGAVVRHLLDQQHRLVAQAAEIHPMSLTGLAAKARIVGHHHDLVTVGRAVLRSLVEDLHTLEPLRRR